MSATKEHYHNEICKGQMEADRIERPILFSTLMVQAIPAGKTKTRRLRGLEKINIDPNDWQFEWADFILKFPWRFTQLSSVNEKSLKERNFNQEAIKCPYGKSGDVLWVRETFQPVTIGYKYKADGVYIENHPANKWKPSIFMPKVACRIKLLIKNIRVERLQNITEQDAIAEGILELSQSATQLAMNGRLFLNYSKKKQLFNEGLSPIGSYRTLWESINGKDSWNSNPWVWVIEFEVKEILK